MLPTRQARWTVAIALWGLAVTSAARGAELTTLTLTSRFVDPAKQRFNPPPPGAPARPNALRVIVRIPDGYDGVRRLPVLYLLHGYSGTYDTWANPERGDIMNTARGFPGLIVMPEGGTGFYADWWNNGRRRAPAWERFYLDELIPAVARKFRVRPARRWHAIAGISMGGEGAMYLASQRPDYFGSAASFSGTLSIQRADFEPLLQGAFQGGTKLFGDPGRQAFYWAGHNPTALVGNLAHTRLYVAAGDGVPGSDPQDQANGAPALETIVRPQSEDFVRAARRAGADVTWRPHQGVHWYPYWRADLQRAIAWNLFAAVTAQPARWRYTTVAQTGVMWGLRYAFEAPPNRLERFALAGRVLAGIGAGTVAISAGRGCRLRASLPFSRPLPHPCSLLRVTR